MPNPNPNFHKPPSRRRRPSLPEFYFKENDNSLKHVLQQMHFNSLPNSPPTTIDHGIDTLTLEPPGPDYTAILSDKLVTVIFSKLPQSQHVHTSLVCKRWLGIQGRLVTSLKVSDWEFLESGRMSHRFPNLSDVDLVRACFKSPRNYGILITHKLISFHVDSEMSSLRGFVSKEDLLRMDVIDGGLNILASTCPNLRKLALINAGEVGLSSIAEECHMLQELELHCCTDMSLKGISGCRNLQVLKLIGCVDGLYESVITDIGLTILAQGCRRLVKLELSGSEGSYDGVKAIGQCCQMLEELTLSDHRMDGGWLAALQYCGNLKTLRLQSCKSIDSSPGANEHLGSCPTLEELHLQRCQMRDKQSVEALFTVCEAVREIVLHDCWGLDDDIFRTSMICRRLKILSLEGCSLLTMEGLDSVIISWKELQRLRVVSCNNIKDSEITPAVATLFPGLKELKWRPDSRSLLFSSLAGTGVGKKGGRFFKRQSLTSSKRKHKGKMLRR